jgi:hypothetical protein
MTRTTVGPSFGRCRCTDDLKGIVIYGYKARVLCAEAQF